MLLLAGLALAIPPHLPHTPHHSHLLAQAEHQLFGLLIQELTEGKEDSGLPDQISELIKVWTGCGICVDLI